MPMAEDLAGIKRVVARYFEAVDLCEDPAIVEALFTPDFVDHNPSPGCEPTREGLRAAYQRFLASGAEGASHTIEDILSERDLVAVRHSATGRREVVFGIPSDGEESVIAGIAMFRVIGGRIAERWNLLDMRAPLVAMGILPG
jgi:predicted ester cyclase